MRDPASVLRSLTAYVNAGLDDATGVVWEASIGVEPDPAVEPFVVVAPVAPATSRAVRAGLWELARPHVVMACPVRASSAQAAVILGEALAGRLVDIFEQGIDRGRPRRVPLAQWGDVADLESSSAAYGAHDFARVVDLSATAALDADDPLRAVVTVDVRLSWLDAARPRLERPVEHVGLRTGGA